MFTRFANGSVAALLACCFFLLAEKAEANTVEYESWHQKTYWIGSVITNGIAMAVSFKVIYDYWTYSVLRKPGICAFLIKVIADCLFAIAFFVHHFGNIASGGTLIRNELWCGLGSSAGHITVTMCFVADIIVALSSYVNTKCAVDQTTNWFTLEMMFYCLAGGFVQGLWWSGVSHYAGTAGAYYGLYCFNNRYNHFSSGGITFMVVSMCSTLLAVVYYKLYCLVKVNTIQSDTANASILVAKRGALVIVMEFGCWSLLMISSVISAVDAPSNIWLEIFAGWMTKWQVCISALLIYNTTSSYRERFGATFSSNKESYQSAVGSTIEVQSQN